MLFIDELILLLKARYPIIHISSFEEDRLEYTIRKEVKLKTNKTIYSWDFIDGYKLNFTNPNFAVKNPFQALELVEKLTESTASLFILKDFNKFLSDLLISRKLRNILNILKTQPKTIIIISTDIDIPKPLLEYITILEFMLPNAKEIKEELKRLLKALDKEIENTFFDLLIRSCQGLSIEKIRRALSKSIVKYGSFDLNTIDFILKEKRQLISQTQLLEFIEQKKTFKDIGGLKNLKNWLAIRKNSFSQKSKLYGLRTPRGLILTGIQGTGKSLTAKAIAHEWELPLLRLDIGRIFAGVIGESENRVRQMIQLIEALAPCVLWIDEIDKAFPEVNKTGDSGTSNRVLGTFINWLAEKKSNVFVVATANNFLSLPLELIRKGRFDEIFFVGLPTNSERKQIFEVFLNKVRPKTNIVFDSQILSENSLGFSGAEIEQSIIEAMHIGFYEKREFTNLDILRALKKMIPISQLDSDRLKKLENLAFSGRIRLASEDIS